MSVHATRHNRSSPDRTTHSDVEAFAGLLVALLLSVTGALLLFALV